MTEPTLQERYEHFRDNAKAFVETMETMVASIERAGDEDLSSKLRVWALMPWQAALTADETGDLWPICEVCSKPIKGAIAHSEDCEFHPECVG